MRSALVKRYPGALYCKFDALCFYQLNKGIVSSISQESKTCYTFFCIMSFFPPQFSGVYAFGFLFMLPQLFVNYKVSLPINMMGRRDRSALRHLPDWNNKTKYCVHVQVYLFVWVHMCLSIDITRIHIENLVFQRFDTWSYMYVTGWHDHF